MPKGNFQLCLDPRSMAWQRSSCLTSDMYQSPTPKHRRSHLQHLQRTGTFRAHFTWPLQKPASGWDELNSYFSPPATRRAPAASSDVDVTLLVFTLCKTFHGGNFMMNWCSCSQTTVSAYNLLRTTLLGESWMVAALNFAARQSKPLLLSVAPPFQATSGFGIGGPTYCEPQSALLK